MKKSRFTDSQIMDALKRSEAGIPVTDICREMGVSTPAFYRWKSKYGGMDAYSRALGQPIQKHSDSKTPTLGH